MRADYDSEAKSIQIWLEETDRLDRDVVLRDGGVIISTVDDKPVLVDVQGVPGGMEESLSAAASSFSLDYEALLAAAEAALAAPDRIVTLSVAARVPVA